MRTIALALTLAGAVPAAALAQPADRTQALAEAATLAAGDDDAVARCGPAYLAIYDAAPDAGDGDAVLAAASACFDRSAAVAAAIAVDENLTRSFPASPLAPVAVARSAARYRSIADYRRAIDTWKRLARLYPAAPEAPEALAAVARYAAALGDVPVARAAVDELLRRYGRARPSDTAAVRGELALTLAERGAAPVGLLAAVARDPAATPATRRRAAIADALATWRGACAITPVAGLCLRLAPSGALAPARGKAGETARAALAAAVAQGAPTDRDEEQAVALARLALAEHAIERAAAIGPMPNFERGPGGAPTPAGTKAAGEWMRRWTKAMADVERQILEVGGGPSVNVARMARLIIGRRILTHAIASLPAPPGLRGTPDEAIYRAELERVVTPMLEMIEQGAEICVAKAVAPTEDLEVCVDALSAVEAARWRQPERLPRSADAAVSIEPEPPR